MILFATFNINIFIQEDNNINISDLDRGRKNVSLYFLDVVIMVDRSGTSIQEGTFANLYDSLFV